MKKREEKIVSDDMQVTHEDYYEGTEVVEASVNYKKFFSGKAIKRYILIFFIMMLSLFFYLFGENFTPEKITEWMESTFGLSIVGDGFPVSVTGSNVNINNIVSYDNEVAVLSDTTLTIVRENGSQKLSYRHSYPNPTMQQSEGNYIIHSIGGQNFTTVSSDERISDVVTEDKVTGVDIAANGRYAVLTQPVDYTSKLSVYFETGELKYVYDFAEGYASSVSIDESGEGGIVTLIDSSGGILKSKIYVFDFDVEEPIAEFDSFDNLITQIAYNGGKQYYCIGDKALIRVNNTTFETFDYENEQLTAVSDLGSRTAIALSSYSGEGPGTVYIFENSITPRMIESDYKVEIIGGYAGEITLLSNQVLITYDVHMKLVTSEDAGFDAKSFVMKDENYAYVLGLSEIRLLLVR